jgi:transcriptional regulator with GAF, ATPase, and Fis domain
MTWREAMDAAAKAYLTDLLEHTGWNVAAAARIAGLNRTDMFKRLRRHGVRRPQPYAVRGALSLRTNRCAAVPS